MKHSVITLLIPSDTEMASLDALYRAIGQLGLSVHQIAPGQTLAAPREWQPKLKKDRRDPAARIRAARIIAARTLH